MDNKKIFLDINVVLNILGAARMKHAEAVQLWEILVLKDYQIYVSEDMLSTVFYINRDDRKYTLEFFKLILNRWQIVPFGKDVVAKAVDLSLENDLDLEDVLQCLCAKENGCKTLITNDKKFYDCGIAVMNCADFIAQHQ